MRLVKLPSSSGIAPLNEFPVSVLWRWRQLNVGAHRKRRTVTRAAGRSQESWAPARSSQHKS